MNAPGSETTWTLGPDRHGREMATAGGTWRPAGHSALDGAPHIACDGSEIVAGGVNAHTHIYSGLAPFGMPPAEPPPENFLEILQCVWWRLDRALDERSLRASARYYVAESLLAGTTTLIDHHESPNFIEGSLDVLADACEELGMRAVLCFGATERNGGREEARRGLAECARFITGNRRPLVRGVVGLHASFTVSDETVREAGDLCRELATPLHVHVAEDGCDLEDARERGYDGPLERLLALEALPAGSLLAHGVHLEAEQIRRAATAEHWFMQNPRSNHGNGVGYPRALGESSRVAMGTDGYPSRLGEEAAFLREEASRHGEAGEVVEARIGAGHQLAAELFDVEFAPLADGGAADAIVHEAGEVRHVLVGGRRVVEDGRLTTADIEEIRTEAAAEAARLWERMSSL